MKTKSICTYCDNNEGTTRDHVPPKCLFPKPLPSNLVTVPCCDSCRKSQGADDEYFMRMIVMRDDLESSRSANQVLEKVHRSFDRRDNKIFNARLIESMLDVPVHTSSGIYVGIQPGYRVDLQRLGNVVSRTTCGLFSELLGIKLSPGSHCASYAIEGFQNINPETEAKLIDLIFESKSGAYREFGTGVYKVWAKNTIEEPQASFWTHLFFEKVAFISLTSPNI